MFYGGDFIKQQIKKNEVKDLVNELIPNEDLRLIDEKGNNRGIIPRDKALEYAESIGLDVVVVSESKPYTAKIMDYSKFKFDKQKKLKEIAKNQKVIQVKEIRLGPTIGENDFQTKLSNCRKFITKGDKVKISMMFRGRMIANADMGMKTFKRFLDETKDIAQVETKPQVERNIILAVIAPFAKKK